MARILQIISLDDFVQTVSDLSGHCCPVFRGQSEDYGVLLPSAFRPNVQPVRPKVVQFLRVFLEYIQNKWETEFYAQEIYNFNIRDLYALMQHYGFPTEFLDVTYDPEIALWFATHSFVPVGKNWAWFKLD